MPSNTATKGARSRQPAQQSKGQKVSRERGTAANHKKSPGKRAHQGGR
jgi:hypothetical protein